MTRSSTLLWETLPILYKFQFPWRFLTVVVFATAVFGGLVLAQIPQKKQLLFLCVLVTVAILFTSQYWQAKSFVTKGDAYFSGIVRTTTNDTGESSPIWSTRSMEIPRVKPMEVIEGNAIVTQTWRSSTNHVYTVSAKKATRLVENTLYFPGWEIQVDNTVVPLQFQDPKYRGLMTFSVTPGVHTVVVQFSETKLRSLANTITMISCVALFVGYFLVRKIKKVFVS
jgi:small-conductance mechanosensitive channel